MKLYDGGRAPSPRRVRIFLAEKGITLPLEPVDLGGFQHKSPAYAAVNPLQRVPALELDDGTVLTEFTGWTRSVSVTCVRPDAPNVPINAGDAQVLKRIVVTVKSPRGSPVSTAPKPSVFAG